MRERERVDCCRNRRKPERCLCVPTRVDGRRRDPPDERETIPTHTHTHWRREKGGGGEKETKLEKSQEIPDFVRAPAGNDANPATVPLYRS